MVSWSATAYYLHPYFGDLTDGRRLALFTRLLERCAPELDVDALISDVLRDAPTDGMLAINRRMSVFDEGFDQRRKAIIKAIVTRAIMPAALRHIHVKDCGGYSASEHSTMRCSTFFTTHLLTEQTACLPAKDCPLQIKTV